MVKYHIATGDGNAYYGVNYESYREAEAVLRFSQKHDPQAHIVEEEYHFTNADRIRAMSDEELAKVLNAFTAYFEECNRSLTDTDCHDCELCELCSLGEGKAIDWLKHPAEGE